MEAMSEATSTKPTPTYYIGLPETVPVSVERIKAWIAYLQQFDIDTADMESWLTAKIGDK